MSSFEFHYLKFLEKQPPENIVIIYIELNHKKSHRRSAKRQKLLEDKIKMIETYFPERLI